MDRPTQTRPTEPGSAGGDRLLLLVEDEADAREVIARRLPLFGWNCLAHQSVESALSDPSLGTIDVAVADVVLGYKGRTGIDLVEALRQRDIEAPVLLITAFADRDMVLRALDAGAAFLLEKPFGMAELCSALQIVVSRRPDALARMVDRSLAEARLTKKEEQIARLTLRGMTIAQVAAATGNAEATVKQHLGQVYAKLGVSTRAEFFHLVFPS